MQDMILSTLPEVLPLGAIRATKTVVVLGPEMNIISEHSTTPDAVKALLRHAVQVPQSGAAIYRCIAGRWLKY